MAWVAPRNPRLHLARDAGTTPTAYRASYQGCQPVSQALAGAAVRKHLAAAEASGMAPGGPTVSQQQWAELARAWRRSRVPPEFSQSSKPSEKARRGRNAAPVRIRWLHPMQADLEAQDRLSPDQRCTAERAYPRGLVPPPGMGARWVGPNPTPNTHRKKVDGVQEISRIMNRLQDAATSPDTLAVSFDAFEAIRQLARGCEDKVPALFAAFMTTADAAVDGRESLTIAPGLPPPGEPGAGVSVPEASASAAEIAGALAALGGLVRGRLSRAATIAATAGDRTACHDAALASASVSAS